MIYVNKILYVYFDIKFSSAKRYESKPNPAITPLQLAASIDLCRKLSRRYTLDMCTSITGVVIPAMASAIAIEVWV